MALFITVAHTCSSPFISWWCLLEKTTVFQIFFDDDVSDGIEYKLDVLCVCGAGHVGVDFFNVSAHVQVQELHFDVVTSVLICVWTLRK